MLNSGIKSLYYNIKIIKPDAKYILQKIKIYEMSKCVICMDTILNNIFLPFGHVCTCVECFVNMKKITLDTICPDTYESTYKEFYCRSIEKVKIENIILTDCIFIKPVKNNKLFDGHVIRTQLEIDNLKYNYPNLIVYKSDVINIISEYRLLIGNGKLYGSGHMKGLKFDNLNNIDINKLIELVSDKFRCIDIGYVDNSEKWIIIEINPMYSLDNYDISINAYMEFCIDSCKWINKLINLYR